MFHVKPKKASPVTKPLPIYHNTRTRREVLRVLCDAGVPLYSVDITHRIGAAHGTVYPILRGFAERGWVVSKKLPSPFGAPHRLYYEITPAGRAVANQLLKEKA